MALDPSRAEYFFLKGNICESLLLVEPALAVLLAGGRLAARLLGGPEEPRPLPPDSRVPSTAPDSAESQYAFHEMMLNQGRLPEALRMAQRLGTDYQLMQRTWAAILAAAGLHADLTLNDDGSLDLDLTAQSSVDLALLHGMPLRKLTLARSSVVDLTPLRDSSVQELDLSGNPLQDLSPLAGLALETLNLSNTGVSNLFPLAGMPLRELNLDHTPVSDLSPLRGLHLQILRAAGTTVWNLQPLCESPIQILDLARTHVADLTPLRHLPLHELILDDTGVTDLQPLEGAPLRILDLSRTPVRSVAPLRGLPLRELLLGGCAKLESVEALEPEHRSRAPRPAPAVHPARHPPPPAPPALSFLRSEGKHPGRGRADRAAILGQLSRQIERFRINCDRPIAESVFRGGSARPGDDGTVRGAAAPFGFARGAVRRWRAPRGKPGRGGCAAICPIVSGTSRSTSEHCSWRRSFHVTRRRPRMLFI